MVNAALLHCCKGRSKLENVFQTFPSCQNKSLHGNPSKVWKRLKNILGDRSCKSGQRAASAPHCCVVVRVGLNEKMFFKLFEASQKSLHGNPSKVWNRSSHFFLLMFITHSNVGKLEKFAKYTSWVPLAHPVPPDKDQHRGGHTLCRCPQLAASLSRRLSNRRYFQHAHFIPIVAVGKRGAY